jgi:SAM-dependent methyltransferase
MFERASEYARHRPSPPGALVPLLTQFARCTAQPAVVDLGCGTGLGTRLWLGHAREIVGVDRSAAMLAEARRSTPEVRWVLADACETGLPSESADVVIAVQALHWMEPRRTLAEVARVLRRGGVFAAVDAELPPLITPELDIVFRDFLRRAASRLDETAPRWEKAQHSRRLQESGLFHHVREFELHNVEFGDAGRFIGLAETAVELPRLYELGATDGELGLDVLRATAERVLGAHGADWYFGYRVRLAVK